MAHRAYKRGDAPRLSLADLREAEQLLQSGTITQEEFDRIKADALGKSS